LSSAVSQTPLRQVSAAAAVEHVPLSVGLVCSASVGIVVPFGTFAVHVCVEMLHQLPPLQSPSTLQPPVGMQVSPTLQAPERHTVAAFAVEHGPSLLA
jgi:hypothetical protein